jgi:hypothetical protein
VKSIGLARIVLDGRHVAGLRYKLDDARVAAVLASRGIAAKLYSGKSEGRVLDLARQLARMRTEACLFHVCADTLAATCELARELRAITPGCRILFWGSTHGAHPALLASLPDIDYPDADGVAELLALPCFTTGERGDASSSPYLTGLLGHADALRLGFAPDGDLSRFVQELAWLAGTECGADSVVPLHCEGAGEDRLIDIAGIIGAAAVPCRFVLHADAAACGAALFDALPAARIAQLHVAGDAAALPAAADAFKSVIVLDTPQLRAARAALYGQNGNVVLHTGSYFDAKQAPGIYHLEVPLALAPEQRAEVYTWAAAAMDIRSAAVLTGADAAVDARLPDFEAPSSRETRGWPKHTYALATESGSNGASMTFDGLTASRQPMRYVPLSELDTADLSGSAVTFITMKTERDAAELERRLERFHQRGELFERLPRHARFYENSCRWMSFGSCRLPLLRRIQVDPSMAISSCRDAGRLGKVGDTYDQIVVHVKKHQQIEEIRRECATCAVRDKCSHCTQLPNEWGGRYCEIRKNYEHTPLYFEMCALLPTVAPLAGESCDTEVAVTVSYSGLPNQYYRGTVGTARSGSRPVILAVAGRHVAWLRGTRKNLRLSAPLALMAEAWWSGAQDEDIVDALSSTFGVDAVTARASLATGLAKLRSEGLANV